MEDKCPRSVTQFSVLVPDLTQTYDHLQIVIWPKTRPRLRFWIKMGMVILAFEPPIPKTLAPGARTCTRACKTLDVVA